ncbi:hypothetical protein I4641_00885 [Waterburya agarophytonicola K14]|uniref:Uncharacterized protein n=1 Tax=Waterburya agarophytonicola KI4 TaxID=2874699 RepID=A0A964BPI1_9CYAN|nr:hypothetical protein [Waterburya agarophytonicola]MCC0175535.1 hypothetical protein [Waterburya agarophytonicola KI4]
MQAYKLQGKVNSDGKLIITEPANLTPGDVEVIVLQVSENSPDFLTEEYELLAEEGLKEVYDREPEGLWEQCLES